MNKRGQVYILAAIVLAVAIFGVIKITNKVETPSEIDNFDFYVENFVGERAYVMDLGYLQQDGPNKYLTQNLDSDNNLLGLFSRLGFNVGVVLVTYDSSNAQEPWTIINYLNQDIETCDADCNTKFSLASAQEETGALSFSLTGSGKKFLLGISQSSQIGDKYFVQRYPSSNEINVFVDGNAYNFPRPAGDRVETILFKNLDKDFVKVVKV